MFKDSLKLTILSFLLTILSFINQLVVANFFGANSQMDLYIIASNLPLLISALITSSLGYSLTPFLIQLRIKFNRDASQYYGNLFKKLFICALVIFVISSLLAYNLSGNYFVRGGRNLGMMIFIFSCLVAVFNILQSFFNSIFNSEENYFVPVYLSFIPYLLSFFCVYFFNDSVGVFSISLGLFIGSIFSFIISIAMLREKISWQTESMKLDINSIDKFILKLPGVVVGMLCFSIYQTVDSYWAPKTGLSNLSYLAYCQRILIALGALIIAGPSTILVPRLTKLIQAGRNFDFLMEIVHVLKLVFALSSVFAVIGAVVSRDIIKVLFERGEFSVSDTFAIAQILPYMLVGMVFMLCVVILFRAIYAGRFSQKAIVLGVLSFFCYFIFSGIGSTYFGIQGIAISYILTWFVLLIAALFLLFRDNTGFLVNPGNFIFIMKQMGVLVVLFIVLLFSVDIVNSYYIKDNFLNTALRVFSLGTIGLISYSFLAIFVFKICEIKSLIFNNFRKLGFFKLMLRTK